MERFLLYCLGVIAPVAMHAQNIQRGEYFFDQDPGFGAGIPISVSQAPIVSATQNISLQGISPGQHVLYIRFKDDAGHWGLTDHRPVRLLPVPRDGDIVAAERYMMSDPGFGAATSVPVTGPAPVVDDLMFDLVTSGLPDGDHTLFLRGKDANGTWSLTYPLAFELAVGIEELSAAGIRMGPNPTRDLLTLRRTDASEQVELRILDGAGQLAMTRKWSGTDMLIDVSTLASGGYVLIMYGAANNLVTRFVKE